MTGNATQRGTFQLSSSLDTREEQETCERFCYFSSFCMKSVALAGASVRGQLVSSLVRPVAVFQSLFVL